MDVVYTRLGSASGPWPRPTAPNPAVSVQQGRPHTAGPPDEGEAAAFTLNCTLGPDPVPVTDPSGVSPAAASGAQREEHVEAGDPRAQEERLLPGHQPRGGLVSPEGPTGPGLTGTASLLSGGGRGGPRPCPAPRPEPQGGGRSFCDPQVPRSGWQRAEWRKWGQGGWGGPPLPPPSWQGRGGKGRQMNPT